MFRFLTIYEWLVISLLALVFSSCKAVTSSFPTAPDLSPISNPGIQTVLFDYGIPCATPPQLAVNTSGWPEVFIGTAAHGCSDTAFDAGSATRPFCNPHLAVLKPTRAPAIFTFLDGEYRLPDFAKPDGSRGAISFTLPRYYLNSNANAFVIVRAATGAKPILLGSVRLSGVWAAYGASPRIFRIATDSIAKDPTGLWQVVDGPAQAYTRANRLVHKMKWVNGIRSHADVSGLDQDLSWTKADANGLGCATPNSGCYLYLRLDSSDADPNTWAIEASQTGALSSIASQYWTVQGITTRFTQSSGVYAESSDFALFEKNDFGHNANSNDNAYSIFIPFSEGVIVRNNRAFDSAYWGGVSNSKGITFMTGGSVYPHWVCHNEIFDIPGHAAIGTKSGVSNLRVIGNYIHDSEVCIETSGPRSQEGGHYGPYHPGGGWIIRDNVLERCKTGIRFQGWAELLVPGAPAPSIPAQDTALNNLLIDNTFAVLITRTAIKPVVFNNIFHLPNPAVLGCQSSSACGAAIYFANSSGETREIGFFLGEIGARLGSNLFFQYPRTHRIDKNWSNVRETYDLATFQSLFGATYAAEEKSFVADPKLDEGPSYRLLSDSPAIVAGNPNFYPGRASVNIGPN